MAHGYSPKMAKLRDRDIRAALLATLHAEHEGDPDTRVVEEFGVREGKARVDVAVFNGRMEGYEIKSAADTLTRLPGQVVSYGATFDRVVIVFSGRSTEEILAAVPEWWGVWEAVGKAGEVGFVVRRPHAPNPSPDPLARAQLLWREELLDYLAYRGLDRGLRSKPRKALQKATVRLVPAHELADHVRERIKARGDWRATGPYATSA